MDFWLILKFFLGFGLSMAFTALLIKIAPKLGVIDKPKGGRKIHSKATPLMGGTAIFLAFFTILFFLQDELISGDLEPKHWIGFFLGALVLMIGGYLDDKYDLPAKKQLLYPVLAAVILIIGGVGIEKITNPLGGYIFLDSIKFPVLTLAGTTYYFVLFSDLLIFFWLMGMMYTTKLLDGVDGLVSSISLIGSLIIFAFTSSTAYSQPDIAIASLVLAGAIAGFLVFNWHPARIFLGEGGSLFIGFALGTLSIISGGKFAIALLIMGIPILDVAWTIVRRLKNGYNPFKHSDRGHLHHRFLDLGIGQRKTVIIYSFISYVFGMAAIFLQSMGKVMALISLIILMIFFIVIFSYLDKKNAKKIVN